MGDRINIYFDQGTDCVVGLYMHWGGSEIDQILPFALEKAKNRWNDPEYGTRIIISNILKDNIDGETGYGIFAVKRNIYHNVENGYRVVDFRNQIIHDDRSMAITFNDYIKFRG